MKAKIRKLTSPLIADECENLVALSKAKLKLRKQLLRKAKPATIKAISECVHNVCNGNVHISPSCKNRLKRHKTCWRRLVDKKVPLQKKRNILVQKGGFLPAFLLPVLGSIASALVSKFT